MVLGYLFKKIGLINDSAASWMNNFVFKIALPVLVFEDLAEQDFSGANDIKFVLFCFAATLISIIVIALLAGIFIKNKSRLGEFIQASYRSSAALLGIAFIHNLYGDAAGIMGPLMILGSVPLYNVFAVIILTLTAEKNENPDISDAASPLKKNKGNKILKTFIDIIKNPIIIGIIAGLLWSGFNIPIPKPLKTIVSNTASLAAPLGLMAMGAAFDLKKALNEVKPAVFASFIKLFVLVAVFIPIAIALGFRGEQLVAILVMLGSASTVSCYIMAKNMGHEGTLSCSAVMLTTLGCSFSLTFWLFILKSLALI